MLIAKSNPVNSIYQETDFPSKIMSERESNTNLLQYEQDES